MVSIPIRQFEILESSGVIVMLISCSVVFCLIVAGIYTIPEISVVGHSEQELTKLRIPYKTGVAKYEETAKGQMMGGPHIDGFLKIMFCPTSHRLLGASAIGESATEIIHIGQSVMSLNGTIEYFRDSVFNFPTYAELFRVAALDGLNKIAATQSATDKFNDDSSNSTGTPTV
jgi:NAD(P) transhydrogenase